MASMSAKFDEEAYNGLVSIMLTSLFQYMPIVTLTSKINRVHPLVIVKMSAKFDEEAHNGLVSIVFTRSTHGRTHGRTEPQQPYNIHSVKLG